MPRANLNVPGDERAVMTVNPARRSTRKSNDEIIDAIFAELEGTGAKTPNEIAIALKANTQTIKRWLDIIKHVQSKPRLVLETGARFTLARIDPN